MPTSKFHEFRILRDAALEAGLSSFTYEGKTYRRASSGNLIVYKLAKSKRRSRSRRR